MFVLDHTNYSRWLPVHIRDMCEPPVKHLNVFQQFSSGSFIVHKTKVFQQFSSGSFAVQKTNRPFSAIALDDAHEQGNASIKGDGGAVAIGLTGNPATLRRWMVSGPEVAQMIREFENVVPQSKFLGHHEQAPSTQTAFNKDVLSVVSEFKEL